MDASTHQAIVTLLRTLIGKQEVGTQGGEPQHSAARDPSTSPWLSQQDISRFYPGFLKFRERSDRPYRVLLGERKEAGRVTEIRGHKPNSRKDPPNCLPLTTSKKANWQNPFSHASRVSVSPRGLAEGAAPLSSP
ncbi:putative portal protein [Clarias magur]|uniref:Putative portal protein n=1 Tax=Clarias magur TaxID=1594786 RepID=A0A8J5CG65_CLAMG|nr:putative portal protein [Clarias magur]